MKILAVPQKFFDHPISDIDKLSDEDLLTLSDEITLGCTAA